MNSIHIPPQMAISNRVLALSREESDRGLVVLMVAFLESRIRVLVPKSLRFSDCIKAARDDQLLTPTLLDNLDSLRKIRNVFAHEWDVTSLDHVSVKLYVDSLCIDPALTMPERRHSKAYVSNVLAYAAVDIDSEIAKRNLGPSSS